MPRTRSQRKTDNNPRTKDKEPQHATSKVPKPTRDEEIPPKCTPVPRKSRNERKGESPQSSRGRLKDSEHETSDNNFPVDKAHTVTNDNAQPITRSPVRQKDRNVGAEKYFLGLGTESSDNTFTTKREAEYKSMPIYKKDIHDPDDESIRITIDNNYFDERSLLNEKRADSKEVDAHHSTRKKDDIDEMQMMKGLLGLGDINIVDEVYFSDDGCDDIRNTHRADGHSKRAQDANKKLTDHDNIPCAYQSGRHSKHDSDVDRLKDHDNSRNKTDRHSKHDLEAGDRLRDHDNSRNKTNRHSKHDLEAGDRLRDHDNIRNKTDRHSKHDLEADSRLRDHDNIQKKVDRHSKHALEAGDRLRDHDNIRKKADRYSKHDLETNYRLRDHDNIWKKVDRHSKNDLEVGDRLTDHDNIPKKVDRHSKCQPGVIDQLSDHDNIQKTLKANDSLSDRETHLYGGSEKKEKSASRKEICDKRGEKITKRHGGDQKIEEDRSKTTKIYRELEVKISSGDREITMHSSKKSKLPETEKSKSVEKSNQTNQTKKGVVSMKSSDPHKKDSFNASCSKFKTDGVLSSFLGTLNMTHEEFQEKCFSSTNSKIDDMLNTKAFHYSHQKSSTSETVTSELQKTEKSKETPENISTCTTKIWENYLKLKSKESSGSGNKQVDSQTLSCDQTALCKIKNVLESMGCDTTTSQIVSDRIITLQQTDKSDKVSNNATQDESSKSSELEVALKESIQVSHSKNRKSMDSQSSRKDCHSNSPDRKSPSKRKSSLHSRHSPSMRSRSHSFDKSRYSRSSEKYSSRSRSRSRIMTDKYRIRSKSRTRITPHKDRKRSRSKERQYSSKYSRERYRPNRHRSRSHSRHREYSLSPDRERRHHRGRYRSRSHSREKYLRQHRSRSSRRYSMGRYHSSSCSPERVSLSSSKSRKPGSPHRRKRRRTDSSDDFRRRRSNFDSDDSWSSFDSTDSRTFKTLKIDDLLKQKRSKYQQSSSACNTRKDVALETASHIPAVASSALFSDKPSYHLNSPACFEPTQISSHIPTLQPHLVQQRVETSLPSHVSYPPEIFGSQYAAQNSLWQKDCSEQHIDAQYGINPVYNQQLPFQPAYQPPQSQPSVTSAFPNPVLPSVPGIHYEQSQNTSHSATSSINTVAHLGDSIPSSQSCVDNVENRTVVPSSNLVECKPSFSNIPIVSKKGKNCQEVSTVQKPDVVHNVIIIGDEVVKYVREKMLALDWKNSQFKKDFDISKANFSLFGAGECPDTMEKLSSSDLTVFLGSSPDIVVLILGKGDICMPTFSCEKFCQNLINLCARMKKEFRVSQILMFEIIPVFYNQNNLPKGDLKYLIKGLNEKLTVLFENSGVLKFVRLSPKFRQMLNVKREFHVAVSGWYSVLRENILSSIAQLQLKNLGDTDFEMPSQNIVDKSGGECKPTYSDKQENILPSPQSEKTMSTLTESHRDSVNVVIVGESLLQKLKLEMLRDRVLETNFGFSSMNITLVCKDELLSKGAFQNYCDQLLKILHVQKPQIIILMMGENDINSPQFCPDSFLLQIQDLLSRLKIAFPKAVIALSEIPPEKSLESRSPIPSQTLTTHANLINEMIREEIPEDSKLFLWDGKVSTDSLTKDIYQLFYRIRTVISRARNLLETDSSDKKNTDRRLKAVIFGHTLTKYLKDGMDSHKYPDSGMKQNFDIDNISVKIYDEKVCPMTIQQFSLQSLGKYFYERPDIVVIMYGEHDLNVQCNNIPMLFSNIKNVISKLRSYQIKCIVITEVLPLKALKTLNFSHQRECVNNALKIKFLKNEFNVLFHFMEVSKKNIANIEQLDNLTKLYCSVREGLLKAVETFKSTASEKITLTEAPNSLSIVVVGEYIVSCLEDCMTRKVLSNNFGISDLNVRLVCDTLKSTNIQQAVGGQTVTFVMILLGESEVDKENFSIKKYIEDTRNLIRELQQTLNVQYIILCDVLSFVKAYYISDGVFDHRRSSLQRRLQNEFSEDTNVIFLSCKNESGFYFHPDKQPEMEMVRRLHNSIAAVLNYAIMKLQQNKTSKDSKQIAQTAQKEDRISNSTEKSSFAPFDYSDTDQSPQEIAKIQTKHTENNSSLITLCEPNPTDYDQDSKQRHATEHVHDDEKTHHTPQSLIALRSQQMKLHSLASQNTADGKLLEKDIQEPGPESLRIISAPSVAKQKYKAVILGGKLGHYIKKSRDYLKDTDKIDIEVFDDSNSAFSIQELMNTDMDYFLKLSPDIVLIMLGDEDLDSQEFHSEVFMDDIRQLVFQMNKYYHVSAIVLCEILGKRHMSCVQETVFQSRLKTINESLRNEFRDHDYVLYHLHTFTHKIQLVDDIRLATDSLLKSVKIALSKAKSKISYVGDKDLKHQNRLGKLKRNTLPLKEEQQSHFSDTRMPDWSTSDHNEPDIDAFLYGKDYHLDNIYSGKGDQRSPLPDKMLSKYPPSPHHFSQDANYVMSDRANRSTLVPHTNDVIDPSSSMEVRYKDHLSDEVKSTQSTFQSESYNSPFSKSMQTNYGDRELDRSNFSRQHRFYSDSYEEEMRGCTRKDSASATLAQDVVKSREMLYEDRLPGDIMSTYPTHQSESYKMPFSENIQTTHPDREDEKYNLLQQQKAHSEISNEKVCDDSGRFLTGRENVKECFSPRGAYYEGRPNNEGRSAPFIYQAPYEKAYQTEYMDTQHRRFDTGQQEISSKTYCEETLKCSSHHTKKKHGVILGKCLQQLKFPESDGMPSDEIDFNISDVDISVKYSHNCLTSLDEFLRESSWDNLLHSRPDFVVLQMGENDIDLPLKKIVSYFKVIISSLMDTYGVKFVMLCSILNKQSPMNIDKHSYESLLRETNAALNEEFVNYKYGYFWQHERTGDFMCDSQNSPENINKFFRSIRGAVVKCIKHLEKEEYRSSFDHNKQEYTQDRRGDDNFLRTNQTDENKFECKTPHSEPQGNCNILIIAHEKGQDLLNAMYNDAFPTMKKHFGISGVNVEIVSLDECPSSISELEISFIDKLYKIKPNIIVIMLGENDVEGSTFDTNKLMMSVESIVLTWKTITNHHLIVFFEIFPQTCKILSAKQFQGRKQKIDNALFEFCEKNPDCRFWKLFESPAGPVNPSNYLQVPSTWRLKHMYERLEKLAQMCKEIIKTKETKYERPLSSENPVSTKVIAKPQNERKETSLNMVKACIICHTLSKPIFDCIEKYGNFNVENLAAVVTDPTRCPATVRALNDSSLDWLSAELPQIILLMLGEHDLDCAYNNVEILLQDFCNLVIRLKKLINGVTIVVCSVLPLKFPRRIPISVYSDRRTLLNTRLELMLKTYESVMFWTPDHVKCHIDELENDLNIKDLHQGIEELLTKVKTSLNGGRNVTQFPKQPQKVLLSSQHQAIPSAAETRRNDISQPGDSSVKPVTNPHLLVSKPDRIGVPSVIDHKDKISNCVLFGACLKQLQNPALNIDFNVVNTDIGIESSHECLQSIFRLSTEKSLDNLLWKRPEGVVLQIGENDIDDKDFSTEIFVSNMQTLIIRLFREYNVKFIVVCSVLNKLKPSNIDSLSYEQNRETINSKLQERFRSRSDSVSFWRHKRLNEFHCDSPVSPEIVTRLFKSLRGAVIKAVNQFANLTGQV